MLTLFLAGKTLSMVAAFSKETSAIPHEITKNHDECRLNNAINSDPKKLRCAPLFGSGYGWRYVQ